MKNNEKIDYSIFELARNPFIDHPRDDQYIFADRIGQKSRVSEILNVSITEQPIHFCVIGGYGSGKTHTLHYIVNNVARIFNGNQGKIKPILSLIDSPGTKFMESYEKIVRNIGIDTLQSIVWNYLAKILIQNKEIQQKVIEKDEITILIEELTTSSDNLKNFVSEGKILLTPLIELAENVLLKNTGHPDFSRGFFSLILEINSIIAWRWFLGGFLSSEERRMLGTSKNIQREDEAVEILQMLDEIFSFVEIPGFFILVDEFEQVTQMRSLEIQMMLNGYRHLIDRVNRKMVFIFACTPEAWNLFYGEYHALSDRIFSYIELPPLSNEKTTEMIIEYLKAVRSSTTLKSDGLITPFTEKAIEVIYRKSKGNPRHIVRMCFWILRRAAEQKITNIDDKTVKKILPEYFKKD